MTSVPGAPVALQWTTRLNGAKKDPGIEENAINARKLTDASRTETASPQAKEAFLPSQGVPTAAGRRLSTEIASLVAQFGEHTLQLADVMTVLGARAYTLLLLVIGLPFCTPIPLPGLSMPFGLVIAWIGFRLALNQAPNLPARLLATNLPPKFFTRFLGATQGLARFLEAILRPRCSGLIESRIVQRLCGGIIMFCGLLLVLPLPVPFSNGFPGCTVVLLAAAIMERDGYCLMMGLGVFALTLCYYVALGWGGAEGIGALLDWLWAWSSRR